MMMQKLLFFGLRLRGWGDCEECRRQKEEISETESVSLLFAPEQRFSSHLHSPPSAIQLLDVLAVNRHERREGGERKRGRGRM
jgi:hypothetical protein